MAIESIDVCRLVATQIWRAERDADPFAVHGLNTEQAVHERLRRCAEALGYPESVSAEAYVALELPGHYESVEDLLADHNSRTELLVRWLVTRHVATHLDTPVSRELYGALPPTNWSEYCRLVQNAHWSFAEGRYRQAIEPALRADRLVRTPSTLIIAAAALANEHEYEAALWAARAALLEPKATFESQWPREMAQRLQRRLRTAVEVNSFASDVQLHTERTAVEWVEPSMLDEPTDVTFLTEEDTAESVPKRPAQ